MLMKIIGGIVVVLGIFLGYVAIQPSEMHVSRELLIKASPEAIFPYINNAKKADEWMPWKDSDPNVVMSYSGPEEGVGSTSSWESTGRMGVGKAVIVESMPNQLVKTQLSYTRPAEMSQLAEISLTPASEGTMIKWSVSGKNNFVGRIFCAFMNMDKVVGGQFEQGLNKLKSLVEAK
jgi:uncharacterized protein YndB with AHSA1/START domain